MNKVEEIEGKLNMLFEFFLYPLLFPYREL